MSQAVEPHAVKFLKAQPHAKVQIDRLDPYIPRLFLYLSNTWILDRVIDIHLLNFEKVELANEGGLTTKRSPLSGSIIYKRTNLPLPDYALAIY